MPAGFAHSSNEAVAGFFATVGRAQTTADAAAKREDDFSILRLRDSGELSTRALGRSGAAPKDEEGRLTHGQLVEVRSAAEIAATLDADGMLDGLPFMPEMAVHCGQSFRVFRRADITCVEGHGLRRMNDAVFLEDVRCDGSAHDGCQRRCLVFWKEAWLKPVDGASSPSIVGEQPKPAAAGALANLATRKNGRYLCQSTVLATATAALPSWNILPFVSQVRDGELTVTRFVQITALAVLNLLRKFLGLKDLGRLVGPKSKSSKKDFGLHPGDWVRVKSREAIAQTLDSASRNRGLIFEPEMSEYAGQRFQIDYSIKRMIHEETGTMIPLNNTVVLKGLVCHGLCAKSCPRSNYWFWREDWLERIPAVAP
jgi:hypothetical protein